MGGWDVTSELIKVGKKIEAKANIAQAESLAKLQLRSQHEYRKLSHQMRHHVAMVIQNLQKMGLRPIVFQASKTKEEQAAPLDAQR